MQALLSVCLSVCLPAMLVRRTIWKQKGRQAGKLSPGLKIFPTQMSAPLIRSQERSTPVRPRQLLFVALTTSLLNEARHITSPNIAMGCHC